jgi:hypothetical protein
MKLIDEWKSAWKFLSVNCMAMAAAIQGTWMTLSDDMKAELPKNIFHIATIAVLVAGIGGRLVKQSPPPEDKT